MIANQDDRSDPLLGTNVGRWRIEMLIGEGGMGRVYLAIQPQIGARVAIKVLTSRNEELVARFFAEARAVNLIRHENVVDIIDLARLPDGRPYLVMEFVEGRTLRDIIEAGTVPLGWLCDTMLQVLDALAAAHGIAIVHRDLKPDNLVISPGGRVKVVDFGIAKLAPALSGAPSARTHTGQMIGTPEYMAPEQIRGGNIDGRTDLYALGVVLYEAATGHRPFAGPTDFEVMRAHLEEIPPSPRVLRAGLPLVLEDLILQALAKEPARRFATATAMSAAIRATLAALAPADRHAPVVLPVMRHGAVRPTAVPTVASSDAGPPSAATVRARPMPRPRRRRYVLGGVLARALRAQRMPDVSHLGRGSVA